MVRIFSYKLICIALVVIIIINSILPSVCYGDELDFEYDRDNYFGTIFFPIKDRI